MSDSSMYDNSYNGLFVEYLKFQSGMQPMKSKHYHDFFEIYYYLGNGMNYFVGDKNYSLEKNNLLLIDKCVFHKTTYNSSTENERVLIEFNDDVFKIISDKNIVDKIIKLFQTKNKIELSNQTQTASIHSLIFNIVSNYYSPSAYGLLMAKLNLAELCLHIVEITEEQDAGCSAESNTVSQKKSENNVIEIIKYINENYNTKITLDDLVDKFFVNKFYLCHIFKSETGLSIIDFVNNKRLSEAENLLRYSDLSVTDICYKVGFNSINHFLKLFKNNYNLTPKKFRNSIQNIEIMR
ncbi:MAG: AraC family transcriptional regulator [Clostridia bacterium]|jgi:AraC-like DNA-binding protein